MPEFYEAVLALPVWDTHTHLNNPKVPLAAQNFWDIGHYLWFHRELIAAGYPKEAERLPEAERRERYAAAFAATKNTAMNWVVTRILRDLYGVELGDPKSIEKADEAVRASFQQPAWPRKVIERLAIRRIAVNSIESAEFPGLPGVGYAIPSLRSLDPLVERVLASPEPNAALEEARAEVKAGIGRFAEKGVRGVRTDPGPFERLGAQAYGLPDELPKTGATADHVAVILARQRLAALAEHKLFAQFFLGIGATTTRTAMPNNDPRRITNLHGLFEQYGCDFELLLGCELNNLDLVQAALVFPNVHAGGLWWFNFRPSTFLECMEYRLEALPPCKSALVASDARCIEWCYGKVLLVKTLLAEFLAEQIRKGWLNQTEALRVAREWLHDAVQRRYASA